MSVEWEMAPASANDPGEWHRQATPTANLCSEIDAGTDLIGQGAKRRTLREGQTSSAIVVLFCRPWLLVKREPPPENQIISSGSG
jgi:hypothetical protein